MKRFSRFNKKEKKRNLRRAVLYGVFAVILALSIPFFGIPTLIKLAVFLGNLRSSSSPVETKDTLPPSPPVFIHLAEATNSAQFSFSGFAEPASTVEVFLNNSQIKKMVIGTDGTFNLDYSSLTEGINEIYATAADEAGNRSAESEKATIWYDRTPPKLEISQPKDKTTQENNKLEVIGKTEPDASITVNEHLTIVDKEGNFRYSLNLTDGENPLKIIAADKAGNQTVIDLTVSYSP